MENNKLVDLISAIKHISLNHNDLMDVAIDFTNVYFSHKDEEHKEFDKFWTNDFFIDQVMVSAREGIVLAMNALTLEKDVPFSEVVTSFVDHQSQNYNVEKATDNEKDSKILRDFFISLRKETFSRIYSQNKELYKLTQLNKELLKERYAFFMKQDFILQS